MDNGDIYAGSGDLLDDVSDIDIAIDKATAGYYACFFFLPFLSAPVLRLTLEKSVGLATGRFCLSGIHGIHIELKMGQTF